MKTKPILPILLTLLLFIAGSCKEGGDDIAKMALSASSFEVTAAETSLFLDVQAQGSWKISSDADWCVVNKEQGSGQTTLRLTLDSNETLQERIANLTIVDATATLQVKITQKGEEHYRLPIVFHVLYADANDPSQNPDERLLKKIVNICNQRFSNKFEDDDKDKNSADLNFEIVMATTDPDGKALAEPGVNRIKVSTPVFDSNQFMSSDNKNAIPWVWNPNKYINIFLYTFKDSNMLGVSFFPYTNSSHSLPGLVSGDRYYNDNVTMSYPHCVSINNTYIDQLPKYGILNGDDVTSTLSHELGHYLGLIHAFGEDNAKFELSWRDDTDYCEDTPNYDRAAYEDWLLNDYDVNIPPAEQKRDVLLRRTSSAGKQFTSRNIMDYYVSLANEYTLDQRKRVRHVLHYSPLVPGPKYDRPNTRAIMDAPIPLMRAIE